VKIVKIEESGINGALLGMGLSYGKSLPLTKDLFWFRKNVPRLILADHGASLDWNRANKLALKGDGHSEYLKHTFLQFLIEAPDFWWTEFDQYKIGCVDLSTSTMHTILNRNLTQYDFESHIPETYLEKLNLDRQVVLDGNMDLDKFVGRLPRGYLYTRVISTNYMALQNICNQRKNHKLPQWKMFIDAVRTQVNWPEWIFGKENE
jgi:hypothetical protein